MDWTVFFAVLGTALVLAIGVVVGVVVGRRLNRRPEPAVRKPSHASFEDDATQAMAVTKPRGTALLAFAPTIDGVTLRDHLTHHSTKRCPHPERHAGTWPCVVEDMYAAAGASPDIAPYFGGVDMIDLKRHFLSALVTVTHVGLSLSVAERLAASHAHLHIPGEHFDAVTAVLVRCIGDYTTQAVIDHVLPQLSPTVRELRARLVTA